MFVTILHTVPVSVINCGASPFKSKKTIPNNSLIQINWFSFSSTYFVGKSLNHLKKVKKLQ